MKKLQKKLQKKNFETKHFGKKCWKEKLKKK